MPDPIHLQGCDEFVLSQNKTASGANNKNTVKKAGVTTPQDYQFDLLSVKLT